MSKTTTTPAKKAAASNAIKKAANRVKTAADIVKRAGRGRPPLDPSVPTTGMSLRMTLNQRSKADRLGGAVFLRKCIDDAPEPLLAPAANAETAGIKAAA